MKIKVISLDNYGLFQFQFKIAFKKKNSINNKSNLSPKISIMYNPNRKKLSFKKKDLLIKQIFFIK